MQIKAKTINNIYSEAEQKLGLRPGTTNNHNGHGAPGIHLREGDNFSFGLSGRMKPQMSALHGTQKMSTMSVTDIDGRGLFSRS